MKTTLRSLILTLALVLVAGVTSVAAQTTVSSTTLSAAADSNALFVEVASATGIEVGDILFVDREAMRVTAISGTRISVRRGQDGTAGRAHGSGAIVYHGPSNQFARDVVVPGSACTAASEQFLPRIVLPSGRMFQCTASVWYELGADIGHISVSYMMNANASLADQVFFIADRPYEVVAVSEIHATAGTDGSAVSLQVVKDTSTSAPGAGTDLLTNNSNVGFNMKGTANTLQNGTLTSTVASKRLAAGDRLSVDFAGTLTSLAGVVVTVTLAPR